MYEIFIRDAKLKKIGQVTDYKQLTMIPRFNGVGSFTLDLSMDTFAAKQLINPQYGIIVKKDGKEVFSGNVTSRKRAFDGANDTLTLSGKDDNNFIAAKIAYPETNLRFDIQAYDVRTGIASTVMMQYVDYNSGPHALPYRQTLSLGTDLGLGTTVTGNARFDNLLDLLTSLAVQGGGLGFKVVQVDDHLQFQVYQPQDKTRVAFFSPLLGNLASFDYSNDDPTSNMLIVGGGGEGTNRIIQWTQDDASITRFGRYEEFIDRRDTTDSTELNNVLNEELTNKAEKNSFNFTAVDIPQLSFNRDYGLGDKVSVVITQPNEVIEKETLNYFISFYQSDSMETERVRKIQEKLITIQDIVREVKITIDSSGEVINPTVGTEDTLPPNVPKIFDDMKKLKRRISNIERA